MTRCEYCGEECLLPFTCQHCRGAFCPKCRLPPTHKCTGIASWEKKPAPGVGISYGRGGTATATGGGYGSVSQRETGRLTAGIPWLKVMIAIVIIIILFLLFLVLSG